ncbi:DUF6461 domain-containing protein [Streptomyces flavofungini]|uniref:Uncharacterized protein n=1 Tax=Streptomyces flavofungini TaxID=68200 RepID=A0ABS0XJM8_9ACTN|nr:DUF6461 domain-containing protein [Streptomyces flavofungini]MBJ3813109.1 hypothetical protein [Streptomyces flavofungini]
MTSPERLDAFLTGFGLEQAATFTAVRGGDEDAVIRLFGGDPGRARPMNLEELRDHYDRDYILVSRSGPAVVVVENNAYQGSREEVLRPLSRLGRTASAYWNVNAVSRLSLAEDGLVLSGLDMVVPEDPYGARPEAWEPLLEGLTLGVGGSWGSGLAAVERATGARFDDAWISGPHRVVEITPVPEYLLGQGLVDSPLLQREPFVGYLADLGPALLGRMRRHALELALAHAGLRDHPLAVAALTADEIPATARERLRDALTAADDTALSQSHALRAEEATDFEPEWERPSHLAFRQAIVFGVLAWCVEAHLPTPTDCLPDITSSLVMAMTGDSERVVEFWMVDHLHDAVRREA